MQIADAGERDEFDGPLGRICGSALIPLSVLEKRSGELAKERPVVNRVPLGRTLGAGRVSSGGVRS